MFDMLSKLGEIKENAQKMKSKIESHTFSFSDDYAYVTITMNGKKDILSICLSDNFSSLDKSNQEAILLDTLNRGLKSSEDYLMNEVKQVIPNIPGMNIFG